MFQVNKQNLDQLIASKAIIFQYGATFKDDHMHYLLQQDLSQVLLLIIEKHLTKIAFAVKTKPNFASLIKLSLKNNKLRNIGCKHLSKIQFPILQWFSLASNEIDDHGVSHLAKLRATKLKTFSLYGNKFTVNGVQLLNKINCPILTTISLDFILSLPNEQLLKIIMFQSDEIVKIYLHLYHQDNIVQRELYALLEQRFIKFQR